MCEFVTVMGIIEHKELDDRLFTAHKKLMKYAAGNSSVIATRKLYFSLKGETNKNELTIKLYAPIQVDASVRDVTAPVGAFACYVEFSYFCNGHLFYGYDELQAINFASDLDPLLRALDKKCNLYFSDSAESDFYFSDACNRW